MTFRLISVRPFTGRFASQSGRRSRAHWLSGTASWLAALSLFLMAATSSAHAQNLTSLGTVAVGAATPATQTITVPITVSGTVASVSVLTMGSPNLDYTAAGADTCTGNAFTAPASCTVGVSFSPLDPGPRNGAVVLRDAAGNTLGTAYLSGIGQGPLAVMVPGAISIAAGEVGQWTQINDGQPATQADLYLPSSIALDGAGDIFIADSKHNRVREVVAATGNIITVAGNGNTGYNAAATIAASTTLTLPGGVALDSAGNLYIADTDNNVIRKVNLTTGSIVTVAGNGQGGYAGDGKLASDPSVMLNDPAGVTVDAAGNLFIADTDNNVIREVSAATGIISTYAGTGTAGYSGDGGLATSATLSAPYAVTFDPAGNVYIPDSGNDVVRRVDASGNITTYAGTGSPGYSGDGGAATSAMLHLPLGVAFDAAGNLYIADARNFVVRKVSPLTGHDISTVAGTNTSGSYNDGKSGYTFGNGKSGELFKGDGIAAGSSSTSTGAGIYVPYAVAVDGSGNLFIAEYFDNVIRKVTANSATLFFTPGLWSGQVSTPQPQVIENDGNADLAFSSIASDTNSAIDSSTTCSATAGFTLTSGQQCTVAAEFAPNSVGVPVVGKISVAAAQANSPLILQAIGQGLSQDQVTVDLSSTPDPSNYGQSVNFMVTVQQSSTSKQGAPTGTVTLYDVFPATATPAPAPVAIGTGTLASGSVTIPVTNLAVGVHSVYASYGGDTYYQAADSAPVTQTVNEQVTVALANTSGNNPSILGSAVTFAATVTVTGNVSTTGTSVLFYNGATYLGSAPLNVGGVASYVTSALPVGNDSITATYTDTNNVSATSMPLVQSVQQQTVTTLLSSPNPSIYGDTVTFTASVVATGTVAPTGVVTFYDGTTSIGTGNLSTTGTATSTATLQISSLLVGAHNITASYPGDTDNFAGTSSVLIQTVQATTTTTALTAVPNPSVAGQSVTFTATVSSNGATPKGKVDFYSGTTLLGTANLNASGVAIYKTSTLAVGSYSITATYEGDANDGASTSAALPFTVIQATTTVQLEASATSVNVGTTVTFTATVTDSGGTPTGSVTFKDGSTTLGSAALNASGVATLNTAALPIGAQSVTAVYQGDASDAGSTSAAVTVTVTAFSTQTVLSASTTTTASNQPVVLQAIVVSASGKPVTGPVTFLNGTATLGTVNVDANSSASLTIALISGTDTITAHYSGDTDDSASTSSAVTIKVAQASDFSVTLSPSSLTIPTGNYANVTIALQSLNGFTDNMALGCSSLPASVTCNFSSTTPALSANGHDSILLTVDTNSPLASGSQARNQSPLSGGSGILAAFLFPGTGLFGLALWRFRRRTGVLKLLALFAVLTGATLAMNGCGGLSLNSASAGTYTIQVTATGTKSNVTHVADLTVQVTK